MKKLMLAVLLALGLSAGAVFAETDYIANPRIDNILNGTTPLPALAFGTGVVGTASIGAGAVTTVKLATNAVTTEKITDGTIVVADLATNAVTTEKILNGTIMSVDLNSTNAGFVSQLSGYSRGFKVAMGSVTGTQIVAYPSSFGAVPAVVIGIENTDYGTGRVFAALSTAAGFTASGWSSIITGGYIAVGLAP